MKGGERDTKIAIPILFAATIFCVVPPDGSLKISWMESASVGWTNHLTNLAPTSPGLVHRQGPHPTIIRCCFWDRC